MQGACDAHQGVQVHVQGQEEAFSGQGLVSNTLHQPLFDTPWLHWVGMMKHKPATEDYVPLFPWLGVVLVGVAVGHWLLAREAVAVAALGRATPAWLAWLGRHSLLVYLLHQPLLIGILRVVV